MICGLKLGIGDFGLEIFDLWILGLGFLDWNL